MNASDDFVLAAYIHDAVRFNEALRDVRLLGREVVAWDGELFRSVRVIEGRFIGDLQAQLQMFSPGFAVLRDLEAAIRFMTEGEL